jgi:hypothetical protein
MRKKFTRERITSATEIAGVLLMTSGFGLMFGLGVALIVGGIAAIVFGYLAG